jgi:hypothetical protein
MSDKTTTNDIKQIREWAEEALNGKEFFVGTVADRLRQAAVHYPHDQAIRTLEAIMDKKFEKEGSLATISQTSLQDLYNQVSGLGKIDAFKEELGDLLYDNADPTVAHYNNDHISGLRGDGEALDLANAEQVGELSNLFAEGPDAEFHRSAFVDNGLRGVRLELLSMGFDNPAVEVAARDNNFVVFAAEVDTAMGRAPFLIPAEIKLGSVLLPSVFVSGNEFSDFTRENVLIHARDLREQTRTATPTAIISTLNKLANRAAGQVKTAGIEESGDAIASTNLDSPGLYSSFVEEAAAPDFSYAQIEVPEPLRELTSDFVQETLLEAGLSFNRDVVVKAKTMLSNELTGMGITHDKISIASEWAQGIIFATNIVGLGGKKTIEVPVEIVNDRTVLMPASFTSGTVVKAFSEEGLTSLAHTKEDGEFAAIFSDKRDMSFKELYNDTLRSAAYGNFVDVEESLAVIEDRFGAQFHRVAFEDLMELVRVGFNSDEGKPLDAIDAYIKEAADKIRLKEDHMKVSNSLLMLYPEDDR